MRPFFSVVIPCYNSKPELIKEVLQSIYDNSSQHNDIEIIIADGDSENKDYFKEVESFKSKTNMNIKISLTPKFNDKGEKLEHGPSNTREYGVKKVTGEWLTFIDHDDIFTNNTFDQVRKIIEQTNEKYLTKSDIKVFNTQTNLFEKNINGYENVWLHGKFYNFDNLWKKYNIHFKTNLKFFEDMYINNNINCALHEINKTKKIDNIYCTAEPIYIWRRFPTSLSNSESNMGRDNAGSLYKHYYDYLDASYYIYLNKYNELEQESKLDEIDIDFYKTVIINCILYGYFFIQAFKFNKYDYLEYQYVVKNMIREVYKKFNMNANSLFDFINNIDIFDQQGMWYNKTKKDIEESFCSFIEFDDFYNFIL